MSDRQVLEATESWKGGRNRRPKNEIMMYFTVNVLNVLVRQSVFYLSRFINIISEPLQTLARLLSDLWTLCITNFLCIHMLPNLSFIIILQLGAMSNDIYRWKTKVKYAVRVVRFEIWRTRYSDILRVGTVRGSSPGGREDICTVQFSPGAHPASYTVGTVSASLG